MEDTKIIDLYWERSETAITESAAKYGKYCYSIAYAILQNREDSEECVNDTWMRVWKAIPPEKPRVLSTFFGRITRNLALDRHKANKTQKRGGELPLVLEELNECIPSNADTEQEVMTSELEAAINRFLHGLSERECNIFLARYWYTKSVAEIAADFSEKQQNIKTILFRSRQKLKAFLEKEELL